jgi:hypothetical protein
MTTIPSRLASVTAISGTHQIARKRVFALYRDWYRSVSVKRRALPGLYNVVDAEVLFIVFTHCIYPLTGSPDCLALRSEHLSIYDPRKEEGRL